MKKTKRAVGSSPLRTLYSLTFGPTQQGNDHTQSRTILRLPFWQHLRKATTCRKGRAWSIQSKTKKCTAVKFTEPPPAHNSKKVAPTPGPRPHVRNRKLRWSFVCRFEPLLLNHTASMRNGRSSLLSVFVKKLRGSDALSQLGSFQISTLTHTRGKLFLSTKSTLSLSLSLSHAPSTLSLAPPLKPLLRCSQTLPDASSSTTPPTLFLVDLAWVYTIAGL